MVSGIVNVNTEEQANTALATPRPIALTVLGTAAIEICRARADADFQIQSLLVSNTSDTVTQVSIHLVDEGASAQPDNLIVGQKSVASQDLECIFSSRATFMLAPGVRLMARASEAGRLRLFGWGVDYRGTYG